MIEIKAWDGRVLYTAQNATDVRAALTDAVKSRADLAGADLTGAYLSGADLTGAYLARANLARADLARADLSGAYLTGAYLARANLARANLAGAYLARANLSGANLARAYLARANLARADLTGAYLTGAYLAGAYLSGANGVSPLLTSPLHMLYDQPGAIRAYKLVTAEGKGPHYPSLTYKIGETVEAEADTDPNRDCAPGINVATLDWVLRQWVEGYRILVVEFTATDIACIPHGSDGKFRLYRCTVVGEKTLDEVGLVAAEVVAS